MPEDINRSGSCDNNNRGLFGMFGGDGCGCGNDCTILFFIIVFLLLFTNFGCCCGGRG